jgi:hypothetical protein
VLYSAVRFAETIDAATGGRIKIEVGRRAGALRNGGSRGSSYRRDRYRPPRRRAHGEIPAASVSNPRHRNGETIAPWKGVGLTADVRSGHKKTPRHPSGGAA